MQLFIKNRNGKKIILDVTASTRRQLANRIGYEFYIGNNYYSVQQVFAEKSSNDTASGAVIGGLLGLLGGGVGVLIGGIAGGLIGGIRDDNENKMINRFNRSQI